MYDCTCISDIERDYEETAAKCRKVELGDYRKEKLLDRLTGRFVRLIAPLL